LKRFTENASHEIQTPLAIIKTKIELLAQSELNESQANVIQTLNDVVNRISKLNQSLLLLTKIENGQFADTECVNISKVLERHIINFEELAEAKNITITKNIIEECEVKMNESLAVVLISNIMVNAIKHNLSHGVIDIELEVNKLSVSNSGEVPTKGASSLFERFEKDTSSADSLGLGLSIVKEICDRYGFQVNYNYTDKMHTISIRFA
jgi:signal transduction histidine kinase